VKQGQSSTPADILVDIFNPYNSANGAKIFKQKFKEDSSSAVKHKGDSPIELRQFSTTFRASGMPSSYILYTE